MSTKPADFFIGVIDFFAIILPGALLSYLVLVALRQYHPPLADLPGEGTAAGWVAFALSSLAPQATLEPLGRPTLSTGRRTQGS